MRFKGKTALVTGAGSGIGAATALRFAQDGAAVLVADLNGAAAEEVVRKIERAGGRARPFQGDLTSWKTADAMVTATLKTFGTLDYAFNNVGGSLPGSDAEIHEVDLDIFDADIRLNVYATMYCMRAEIRHFLAQGGGTIVNTSSLAGLGGTASNVSYSIGKHGVVALSKSAAIAYGTRGIRVNAICPGAIDTPMVELNFSGDSNWRQMLGEVSVFNRIGEPSEVANLVTWLCSDEASFMTGVAIPIDGGASAFAVRVRSARQKN